MSRADPRGTRLPIKIDSTSATANARRLGITRRRFLVSSAGAASTLLAFNEVNAAAGKLGAFYQIPGDAALDDASPSATAWWDGRRTPSGDRRTMPTTRSRPGSGSS